MKAKVVATSSVEGSCEHLDEHDGVSGFEVLEGGALSLYGLGRTMLYALGFWVRCDLDDRQEEDDAISER